MSEPKIVPRKIVQIASHGHKENQFTQSEFTVLALCDDGSLWSIDNRAGSEWRPWPSVPPRQEATDVAF